MQVSIKFSHSVNEKDSLQLKKIADILQQDYDLPVEFIRKDPGKGVKDGGLTIALSIIAISVSAIGTIISALGYWKSQQPNYSVSLQTGNKTIVVDKIKPDKLHETISKLEDSLSDAEIVIERI